MSEFKIVFNDFLDDFDSVRYFADKANFKDTESEYDGAIYPNLCTEIPNNIKAEVFNKISGFFGVKVKSEKIFMRLSLDGDKPPHAAHNDSLMGKYTFMLYLNRLEDCKGGTSFVNHKDIDIEKGIVSDEHLQVWENDTNKRQKWDILDSIKMQTNKALMFNSNFMHWAEMPYCFGDNSRNGRLLLIAFFDL